MSVGSGAARPEVTVVVPTRNRWPLLQRTLSGVWAQEDVDLEAIVVDDGSTDETPKCLAELGEPRLRVIRRTGGQGVGAARNAGVGAARGEWLAFLDDDDLWAPTKLRRQLEAARAAGATFAYASAAIVNEELDLIDLYPAPDPDALLEELLPGNIMPAGASNVIARTDAVRALGGFDEDLHQLTGWDLWIKLTREGRPAACDEVLLAYVQHPAAMLLSERKRELLREFDLLADRYDALGREMGVNAFDRPGLVAWIAWGDSRAGRRFRAAAGFLRTATMHRSATRRWYVRRAIQAARGVHLTDSGRPVAEGADRPTWLDAYR